MNLFRKAMAPGAVITEVSPEEASSRSDLSIVDVRQPDEWTGDLGHIKGSQLYPLDALMVQPPPGVSFDAPVLLVCRSGARSMMAAKTLAKQGFTQVHNLSGGMMAWNQAGLPVGRKVG